jgi:hypothetical protein
MLLCLAFLVGFAVVCLSLLVVFLPFVDVCWLQQNHRPDVERVCVRPYMFQSRGMVRVLWVLGFFYVGWYRCVFPTVLGLLDVLVWHCLFLPHYTLSVCMDDPGELFTIHGKLHQCTCIVIPSVGVPWQMHLTHQRRLLLSFHLPPVPRRGVRLPC